MKRLPLAGFALTLVLVGCTTPQPKTQVTAPKNVPQAAKTTEQQPEIIQHNLSRVAGAKAVTAEMLEGLTEGKTTRDEVINLLGDIKPFNLGDGKSILRYDVGKFIFDPHNVLLKKFLNP